MAQQWQMACPVCGAPVWIFLHYIRPTVTHCFSADEYIVFGIPDEAPKPLLTPDELTNARGLFEDYLRMRSRYGH